MIKELARGTRIVVGDEAKSRRDYLNQLIEIAEDRGFNEITLPILEKSEIYTDKAGSEVLNQMYTFPDKKGRELCLRPEGTATIQLIANQKWKYEKNIMLWYFTPCFRYERPQSGRFREFYQFGLEVINPTADVLPQLIEVAEKMVSLRTKNYEVNTSAKRGLAYYENGEGFEISVPSLGAQKQVVGGGRYAEGVGFAAGFDRLMIV